MKNKYLEKMKFKFHLTENEMSIVKNEFLRSKQKDESINNKKNSIMEGYTLEDVLGRFPHEHKLCQEGWGMDEGLYEALCDHYFKEGRIPHKIWHGSLDDLRRHVEECYMEDTGVSVSEDAAGELAGGMLGRAAGTAVGGPVGGAVGGAVGAEIGDKLEDKLTAESDYLDEETYDIDDFDEFVQDEPVDIDMDSDINSDMNFDDEILDEIVDSESFPSPSHHGELADIKIKTPAYLRKEKNPDSWKLSIDDLDTARDRTISGPEGLAAHSKHLGYTTESSELKEKWNTKLHTSKKDMGKWDRYSVAELKAKKAKLMKKEERTSSEQKEVQQINFAIRAKQTDGKWGKIK